MSLVPALLVVLAAQAVCDPGKRRQGELAAESEPWFSRHAKDCTLCADGSACREGFERRLAIRRAFDAWRAGHAAAGCVACAAVQPASTRCGALEAQRQVLTSDAQARHKAKEPRCDLEPSHCDAWRAAAEEARRALDVWKRDHAGACERCAPDCEDWRRKAKEAGARAEDSLNRHRERCAECKAGACDRGATIKEDAVRQRQTLWRSHVEMCSCAKAGAKR
jgi:hypothetical protein